MAIIEFLKDYGVYILGALSIIFEIIILLVKKRPKTIDDFVDAIHQVGLQIPCFISEVEKPGEGSQKKALVLDYSIQFLKSIMHRELSASEIALARSDFDTQIERVLSSPQKKEI